MWYCRRSAGTTVPRSSRAQMADRREGRISVLKRRHGLRRSRYRGILGIERWVGLGVIANNLLVLGRAGPQTQ